MKKLTLTLLLVCAVFLPVPGGLFCCDELRVLIWSEYMPEDYMDKFTTDTGIKSRVELYESTEELVAKLQAGGVNQYDVVVPSDYIINTMIKLNLLQKLDHSKLPNLPNLEDAFKNAAYDRAMYIRHPISGAPWACFTTKMCLDKIMKPPRLCFLIRRNAKALWL